MAISRMQQPRQNYGLGSFVKKLTRKVTKPFTKVARKIVPKEIAGIMRTAAPFLPPGYREAAYLLGTAKQTGRISPMDLALTAAPYVGKMTLPTEGRLSKFIPKNLQDRTIKGAIGQIPLPFTDRNLEQLLVGKKYASPENKDALTGIFGKGGEMYKFGGGGEKGDVGIFDTKAGQKLFGTYNKKLDKFVPSYTKIGAQALAIGDFINTQKQLEKLNEGASDVVEETAGGGVTDSEAYQKFLAQLAALNPEAFRIPERLRLTAKGGGLMRTNFAMGSDEDPKPLPEDPTKPINPFGPKPIKPLGDMKMAGMDRKMAAQMLADELAEKEFGMDFYDLDIRTQMKIYQIALDMIDEGGGNAMGGLPNDRTNFALGTRPTDQESGLGGLPIEADMRYTGGFMPYGAKEKADDVPARLSKNEFVFTADAVRAAGGGSVQKGAQKMYNTMKQLEAKPEAKGMMA